MYCTNIPNGQIHHAVDLNEKIVHNYLGCRDLGVGTRGSGISQNREARKHRHFVRITQLPLRYLV